MNSDKRSPAASVLKNRLVAIRTSESVVYEAPKKTVQSKGKIFHVCGEMRLPKLSRKSVKTDRNDLIYVGKWLVFRFDLEKLLDKRWEKASCIAQYTGVNMGYAIAKRARARIEEAALSGFPPLQTGTVDVIAVQVEENVDAEGDRP